MFSGSDAGLSKCTNPKCSSDGLEHLAPEALGSTYCDRARAYYGKCRPSGKYWEPPSIEAERLILPPLPPDYTRWDRFKLWLSDLLG